MYFCRTSTPIRPKSPLIRQRENGEREEEEEEEEEKEEEEEGRIVPQLRIGKDGSIVLDEQRYATCSLTTDIAAVTVHALTMNKVSWPDHP